MIKKILFTLITGLFSSTLATAYQFEVNEIYYNRLDSRTVEVTHGGSDYDPESGLGSYTGWYDARIPETVTYGGVTYTVVSIGDNAFAWSNSLDYVEIPNTVISIGFQAFNGCGDMKRAVIPASVKYIASAAYSFCYDLTDVTLGSSVETIGPSAFGWCSNLTNVICEAIEPPVLDENGNSVIYGDCFSSYSKATLRVPRESLHKYMAAEIWSKFSKIISIEDELGIGDVDNDGKLSIKDVTSLIDDLLEGNDSSVYADVDGDGNVSIKDVTALIDQLLSGAQ